MTYEEIHNDGNLRGSGSRTGNGTTQDGYIYARKLIS